MIEVTGGPEGRGGPGLINYNGKSRSSVRCWTRFCTISPCSATH